MCGEHLTAISTLRTFPGSSPHVRGAQTWRGVFWASTGIIPACAGSTKAGAWRIDCRRDHPRMCGEHNRLLPRGRTAKGSSPHVRGALRNEQGNVPRQVEDADADGSPDDR